MSQEVLKVGFRVPGFDNPQSVRAFEEETQVEDVNIGGNVRSQ